VKMSKSRGAESGTVLLLDPPETSARRSRAPSPTRQRTCATTRTRSGHLEPDRAADGRHRRVDQGRESPLRRLGLRPVHAGRRGRDRRAARPDRESYRELRADVGEAQRMLTVGADKARAASAPTLELMYERIGFTRP
jgi:tryptophanyl-tRNA synthetase